MGSTMQTPSTTTTNTDGSPYVTNPGVLGRYTDISHDGISLQQGNLFFSMTITIIISSLALF